MSNKESTKISIGYSDVIYFLIISPLVAALLHFESLSIGQLKISHMWKMLLLVYLLLGFYSSSNTKAKKAYSALIALGLIQFLNGEVTSDIFNVLNLFFTFLLTAFAGVYLQRFTINQREKFSLFVIFFVIFSFVPYNFGFIESLNSGYDLENFFETGTSLVGMFQNIHAASGLLAVALVSTLYFILEKKANRFILFTLFLIGLFFLLKLYARTGMAMVFVSSFYLFIHFFKNDPKKIFIASVLLIGCIATYQFLVASDNILLLRLSGDSANFSENDFNSFGSGRGLIWLSTIEIFKDMNVVELAFGIGRTELLSRMYSEIGMTLVPHNGFLELLVRNGLVGFFLGVTVMLKLFILSRRSANSPHVRAILLSFVVYSFFQSFDYIFVLLYLSLTVPIFGNTKVKNSSCLAR